MVALVKFIVVAFAGAGATDLLINIFGNRQTPQQAFAGINWIRLLVNAAVIGLAIFAVRHFWKKFFDN